MRNALRLILVVMVAVSFACATSVRPMSVDKLTNEADIIVEGHAVQTWSAWNPQHTQIYTFTRFAVSRSLKGGAASTVTVKQPGGVVDGTKETVYGVRHLQTGEQSVLFLYASPEGDGTHRVVGLMQGNFRVYRTSTGDTHVSNGMPEVTAVTANGRMSPFTGSHMTLQQLESHVRAVTK